MVEFTRRQTNLPVMKSFLLIILKFEQAKKEILRLGGLAIATEGVIRNDIYFSERNLLDLMYAYHLILRSVSTDMVCEWNTRAQILYNRSANAWFKNPAMFQNRKCAKQKIHANLRSNNCHSSIAYLLLLLLLFDLMRQFTGASVPIWIT